MRNRNLILPLMGLALLSCGSHTSPSRGAMTLAVSLPPQKAVLDYLTSDSLDVVTVISADANPESWEPSMNDFVKFNNAAVLFTTGQFSFESTVASSLDKAVRVVDSCDGIDMIYGTHDHPHSADPHEGHDGATADPHVWTSTANLRVMASNMASVLSDIDPDYSEKYRRNLSLFNQRLDSIDASVTERLKDAPSRSFLIWHPSLSYFARDYGLDQIPLGEENKEVSVTQMREKIDLAHASGCSTMFIQSNYDARQAGNVASQLGLEPVPINPVDYDWESQFNIIIDAICR